MPLSKRPSIEIPPDAHPNKLLAVSSFHAGLVHDLNNRLTILLGNLELVSMLLPEEQDVVREMRQAAGDAARLVGMFHTFTRRDRLPAHPVNLNDTLRLMHDLLQRLLGEESRFSLLLPDHALYIEADEGAVEQVLVSCMGLTEPNPVLRLELSKGNSGVEVFCAGRMTSEPPPETLALLHTHRGRFDRDECGWSLGFPECHPERPPPAPPPPPGEGKRVLLAESDPGLREHLARGLRNAGFNVSTAGDVFQVRDLLTTEPLYELAALDTSLPGGGGAELAKLSSLPPHRVWLPPWERTEPGLEGQMLPKPFPPAELNRILCSLILP